MLGRHLLKSGKAVPTGTVWDFTQNASFEVPASGRYKITLVGAGGNGGHGQGGRLGCNCGRNGRTYVCRASSGGGGGSGQTIVNTVSLKSRSVLNVAVGQTGGQASSIQGAATMTAKGGAAGQNGQLNSRYDSSASDCRSPGPGTGYGGAGGASFNPGGKGSDSFLLTDGGSVYGGSGGVSDYGGNVGRGGTGGIGGTWDGGGAAGGAGSPGICRIEYLGR